MASEASVSSSSAATSASGTKRPPNTPKWPVASGQPGRAGRGCSPGCGGVVVVMPLVSRVTRRLRCRAAVGTRRVGPCGSGILRGSRQLRGQGALYVGHRLLRQRVGEPGGEVGGCDVLEALVDP